MTMPEREVPFDLITDLSANLSEDEIEDRRELLAQRKLPPFLSDHENAARRYRPSPELLFAINMALHTGSPLLLTGEPI